MTKMHVCIRHIMAHKAKHCVQAYIQCEWRSERPSVVIYVTIDYEKLKFKENEMNFNLNCSIAQRLLVSCYNSMMCHYFANYTEPVGYLIPACVYACVYICMYVYMHACTHVCMHCIQVCMYVCVCTIHVCMHVRMHLSIMCTNK